MSVWLLLAIGAVVGAYLVLWALCTAAKEMDRQLGVEDNPRWDDRYRREADLR